jgi:hypothetical protein
MPIVALASAVGAAPAETAPSQGGLPQVVEAAGAREYEAPFQRKEGWTGADGAYSIPLDANRTLWLFGDTWVGKITDQGHAGSRMINNSVALQTGLEPNGASIRFLYRQDSNGAPASFWTPADGNGLFWPVSGARTEGGLYVLAARIEMVGGGVFGFAYRGTTLLHARSVTGEATDWRFSQAEVPHGQADPNDTLAFGSAVLRDGSDLYVYGHRCARGKELGGRTMVVARAPAGAAERFDQWRFFDGNSWTDRAERSADLFAGAATEFSVSHLPGLKKYVAVYTENGLSAKVLARFADHPAGAWSKPVLLYECPETTWHKSYFCYAGKAHPELARRDDEIIITYAVNSTDFSQLVHDVRIYWPRFVRVRVRP